MDDIARRTLLASVECDLARLEAEAAELHRIRVYLTRSPALEGALAKNSVAAPAPSAPATVTASTVTISSPGRWRRLIENVLRAAGPDNPMRAATIAEELVKRHGVAPREGRGLEKKVYTVMFRRRDLFVNTGDGLWTLAEYRPELTKVTADKSTNENDAESNEMESELSKAG